MSAHEISFPKATVLRGLLTLQAFFVALPRWLLLAVIVYAPWAYGCTRWWTKTLLAQVLVATMVLWVCSLGLRRRWPRTPAPRSDRSVLAVRTRLVLRVQLFGKLRRTVANLLTPRPGRARLVRLLGWVVFAAVDASGDRAYRRIFHQHGSGRQSGLEKEALSYACLERWTPPPLRIDTTRHRGVGIFWEPSPPSTFFATYFYHANAGAFINLTLPLVAGQTILAFKNKNNFGERSGVSSCSLPLLLSS